MTTNSKKTASNARRSQHTVLGILLILFSAWLFDSVAGIAWHFLWDFFQAVHPPIQMEIAFLFGMNSLLYFCGYWIFSEGCFLVTRRKFSLNPARLVALSSDKFPNGVRRVLLLVCGIVVIVIAYFILVEKLPTIGENYTNLMRLSELAVEYRDDYYSESEIYAKERLIKSLLTVAVGIYLCWAGFILVRDSNVPETDTEQHAESGWFKKNAFQSLPNMKSFSLIFLFVLFVCGVIFGINRYYPSLLNLGGNTYSDEKASSAGATTVTPPAPSDRVNGKQMGGAIQGTPLNLTGAVSTLVIATHPSATDDASNVASFNQPQGITTDGSNLYVADSENNKIRKIVISSRVVTTLAGSGTPGAADSKGLAASFDAPRGIVADGSNLYVADSGNDIIRKIVISTGEVSTLAGTAKSSGAADGTGAAASFFYPRGITTDGSNLYVADSGNHKIRKIVIATGVVTTLAGSESAGATDGTGAAASFNSPEGIATDRNNLYVADRYNHKIRKIAMATGVVTTLAGSNKGFADGIGAEALFNQPAGVTIDGGSLYVADNGNNSFRKILIATGEVITPEGNKVAPQSRHSRANAEVSERSYKPNGIATDGNNLYVSDAYHHSIRKIEIALKEILVPAGALGVATLAGTGEAGSADNSASSTEPEKEIFNLPAGVTTDGKNLYVADSDRHIIRKIVIATGLISDLAGSGTLGSIDAAGASASFNKPTGITSDANNIFVVDSENHTIRKIVIASGAVTTLAGSRTQGAVDAAGTEASFNHPFDITTDGNNLYVADSMNSKIRKIVIATGAVTTLAGSGTVGSLDATGTAASFSYPRGLTTDGNNLYVADSGNNKIRKIVIATGVITTLAGSGAVGYLDATGTEASFSSPRSITTDGSNLYVTDSGNNRIRKIVIATGVVTTLAGSGAAGSLDATGATALFHSPQGITTDGKNLYVADSDNHKIRIIK